MGGRGKVLIFIVAYNHEKTIQSVLSRVPSELGADEVEILVIDDSSSDQTFQRSLDHRNENSGGPKLTVLYNPVNQGYGGNQKLGYHYAIENGFDAVALVHGDGQYAPEKLPELLAPILTGQADAVFGSRMLAQGSALAGGMPLYKYVGNKILTYLQNRLLGTSLSEFHSGYRVYSVDALRRIPFQLNSNDFHFDTQIIIELVLAEARILELPIPTYYGDEICNVDGLKYAKNVMIETVAARLQRYGIGYQFRYDVRNEHAALDRYESKVAFDSSHRAAINAVPAGARVLDIGSAAGHVAAALREKGCSVVGIDQSTPPSIDIYENFHTADLDSAKLPADLGKFDRILLLDVIEHLSYPENFVSSLYRLYGTDPDVRLVVTTGNVAFLLVRLALLFGQFNYGARGILDLTHRRLFTFGSLRRMFEERGFEIVELSGIPAPFPLAFGDTRFARFVLALNRAMIRLSRGLFSYQIFLIARPRPSLDRLLADACRSSVERTEEHEAQRRYS